MYTYVRIFDAHIPYYRDVGAGFQEDTVEVVALAGITYYRAVGAGVYVDASAGVTVTGISDYHTVVAIQVDAVVV